VTRLRAEKKKNEVGYARNVDVYLFSTTSSPAVWPLNGCRDFVFLG